MENFEIKSFKETVQSFVHKPSGLRVYYMRKKGFTKAYASYMVKFGSDELHFTDKEGREIILPPGTAHFLEHKMFEQEELNAGEQFTKLGASANAGTGHNTTRYYFSCTDHFEECLKILLTFITKPYITDENVEKEKGIIIQEIKMYKDDQECELDHMTERALLWNSNYKNDIAGEEEDVQKIDRETLLTAYNNFYTTKNSFLFISGDFEVEEIVKMLDRIHPCFTTDGNPTLIFPEEKDEPVELYREAEGNVANKMFEIGIKLRNFGRISREKKYLTFSAMEWALEMIIGKSSDFYFSLYDSGLINKDFYIYMHHTDHEAFICFGGESEKPEKVLEKIKKELRRRKRVGFQPEEFKRVRNVAIGNNILMGNNPGTLNSAMPSFIATYGNNFDFIDKEVDIELPFIKKCVKIITENDPVLVVMKPEK